GGRLVIVTDEQGRAIVENFPATLPTFFRTFCALNADNEALVSGDERFTFAELDRLSDGVAAGLVARGISKGDRVGIAMRNCVAWVLTYMAIAKAGAVATLLNGWWEPAEMEHAIRLTDPKLILADPSRGERIAARCSNREIVCLPVRLSVDEALADLLADGDAELPEV